MKNLLVIYIKKEIDKTTVDIILGIIVLNLKDKNCSLPLFISGFTKSF